MKILLDTNVISEWIKPHPAPSVVEWLSRIDDDDAFLSVITLGELQAGIEQLEHGRRRALLETWLNRDLSMRFDPRVIPNSRSIAIEWGKVTGLSQRTGTPIGAVDALLAATASVHQLSLATRNVRHFATTSVHIINPWDPAE